MALEDVFKGGNIVNGLLIGAGIGLATKGVGAGCVDHRRGAAAAGCQGRCGGVGYHQTGGGDGGRNRIRHLCRGAA